MASWMKWVGAVASAMLLGAACAHERGVGGSGYVEQNPKKVTEPTVVLEQPVTRHDVAKAQMCGQPNAWDSSTRTNLPNRLPGSGTQQSVMQKNRGGIDAPVPPGASGGANAAQGGAGGAQGGGR